MRSLVRRFDDWFSLRLGINRFSDDPFCILRIQHSHAYHSVVVENQFIHKGDSILAYHLWNERVPLLPPGGADFTWAAKTLSLFRYSLRLIARELCRDETWIDAEAIYGASALFPPPEHGEFHPMERLGFYVMPYHSPLGSFGNFWENFYSWLIMWAYNPPSTRRKQFWRFRRSEMWIGKDRFLKLYSKNEFDH